MSETHNVTFLVVGGGIAGVSCAETLVMCCPSAKVLLLTESSVVKTVSNLQPIARYLHKFDVRESTAEQLLPSILTLVDTLRHIESANKQVYTLQNHCIKYKYLCICTGGQAHVIAEQHERVLGIRDTDSVRQLQKRLETAKKVAIVGNGGIASEMVHELKNVEVHWLVKDNHVASTFVDAGAAYFLMQKSQKTIEKTGTIKRWRYSEQILDAPATTSKGAALGPDWQKNFPLCGNLPESTENLKIYYQTNVTSILTRATDVILKLSTGEELCCDFLVSATGVEPRHEFSCDAQFVFAADGGLCVNEMMQTNLPDIYAAGDVCTANWTLAEHWFQMRLWTQARQMGIMAARSMTAALEGEQIYQDFCFELFGHVTQLFGYSVILLGRYNGQGLGTDYEILLRTTPAHEYIKFVIKNGRLRGALLIGNTEMAETCENLILNAIDLTPFGDDILNPDIDIEDYFD